MWGSNMNMSKLTFLDALWLNAKAYGEKNLRLGEGHDDLVARWNKMCEDRSLNEAESLLYNFHDAGVERDVLFYMIGALVNYYDAVERILNFQDFSDSGYAVTLPQEEKNSAIYEVIDDVYFSRDRAETCLKDLIAIVQKE